MKKVLVKGPVFSRSGYGEQTRFLLRSLKKHSERFDIHIENIRWGNTGWIVEDDEERQWLDRLTAKTYHQISQGTQFDISIQVTIPQEWQKLAPINIGYTAGTETTKMSKNWVQAANIMDKIIVPSKHAKFAFDNTIHNILDEASRKEIPTRCTTPVEVVNFPVRQFEPAKIDIDPKYDFNFLAISQWSPRKNLKKTIKWFIEEFKNEEVGLILKINIANDCTMDRERTLLKVKKLINDTPDRKCAIHVLHGTMSDSELTGLYQHPKVKALVNISHGEGFGLPMFEAAHNGLPVVAPAWSGQMDFLRAPIKNKKTKKTRMALHFAKVEYDIKPIQDGAVWEPVLIKNSYLGFSFI